MRRTVGSLRSVASVLLTVSFLSMAMGGEALAASSQAPDKVCLRGMVRTPDGRPVKDLEILCFHIGASDMPFQDGEQQTSDEKGRYEFHVMPGLQYFVATGGKTSTSAQSERVLAERGKDVAIADLIVRPFSATIQGHVVREDGRPAAHLNYGFLSANCSPVDPGKPPTTGDNGEFTIHLLPDEPFAFWVFVDKSVFHVWRRLDPNTSPLQLTLREKDRVPLPEDWRSTDTHEAVARYMSYAENDVIDFSLPDLDGRTVSLADLRAQGKAVVVNLTGSWCGGCRQEAPYLVEFYKRYREQGLEVVSIAFERESNERPLEAVRSFREEFGIDYTLLYGGSTDRAHVESVIRGLKCFQGYPATLYIDRKGKVQFLQTGFWIHSEPHKKWQLDLMETHIRTILLKP